VTAREVAVEDTVDDIELVAVNDIELVAVDDIELVAVDDIELVAVDDALDEIVLEAELVSVTDTVLA
jgi:hypothetical protein